MNECPLNALPLSLRAIVEETAQALSVPVDLVALPVLVAAGTAIGRSTVIRLKNGWTESSALYGAIVAATGSGKTQALGAAVFPIHQRQAKEQRSFEGVRKQYQVDLAEWRKKKGGEKPIPPAMPRTWTTDATVECLGLLLTENPRGLLMIHDELSAWVKSQNQYRSGKGADRHFYLSTWSGQSTSVDRLGRDSILIESPFLSVVGNIPPGMLSDLSEEHGREDGFIQRLLFAFPDPMPVRWTDQTVSQQAQDEYDQLIQTLYSLEQETNADTGTRGPVCLDLSSDARHRFMEFFNALHMESESPSVPPILRGFYSKLIGYCGRLALIHAVSSNPDTGVIGVESIESAIALIDYFKAQAAKVCTHLTQPKKTPMERCEKEIVRNLSGGRLRTKRELQQGGNAEAKVFNPVFQDLVREGKIIETMREGKRRSEKAFRLHDSNVDT